MPIPKIIWQTYSKEYEDLPKYLKAISGTWQEEGFEYRYISNNKATELVADIYPKEWLDFIKKSKYGMVKADIIRVLLLYEFGGIYADIDTILKNKIESWIDLNKDMFLIKNTGQYHPIMNDLLGFSPKNPILKSILDEIYRRCSSCIEKGEEIVPYHTGPYVFIDVINQYEKILPGLDGIYDASYYSNYIHINGLSLKDNIDFDKSTGHFDFSYLNEIYKDYDMSDIDIKIYKKKSGYGS